MAHSSRKKFFTHPLLLAAFLLVTTLSVFVTGYLNSQKLNVEKSMAYYPLSPIPDCGSGLNCKSVAVSGSSACMALMSDGSKRQMNCCPANYVISSDNRCLEVASTVGGTCTYMDYLLGKSPGYNYVNTPNDCHCRQKIKCGKTNGEWRWYTESACHTYFPYNQNPISDICKADGVVN